MNYNILAYLLYIVLMTLVIVVAGRYFHKNGRVFILALFRGDAETTDSTNNLLLITYYLFNIGYAFVTLRTWGTIKSLDEVIASISTNMGLLIFILASTHYFNIGLIFLLSKSKKSIITSKTFQS